MAAPRLQERRAPGAFLDTGCRSADTPRRRHSISGTHVVTSYPRRSSWAFNVQQGPLPECPCAAPAWALPPRRGAPKGSGLAPGANNVGLVNAPGPVRTPSTRSPGPVCPASLLSACVLCRARRHLFSACSTVPCPQQVSGKCKQRGKHWCERPL